MKRISKLIEIAIFSASFVLLLVASPPRSAAQGTIDGDRAQEAITRTDEVIAGAKTVVEDSRSQKAQLSLQVANGLQLRAKQSLSARGYGMAYKLTIQAREEAWHAIALARSDAQFEQNNVRVADETRERIARLRDLMVESGVRDEQAMKLMEQSRNLLEKSRLNAQQLRFQIALKLAMNAEQLAIRAEEHIRNTRAIKEAAERRLALLERLMERSREQVQDRDREGSRMQIKAAEEQLEKGRELLAAGRYREAKQALERCEKSLRNSVRHMSSPAAGDPRVMLEEAHRLLVRAQQIISESGGPRDPKAHETLERAREMLRRAEDAIDNGRAAEGTALIARIREMLRAATREHSGDMTDEALMLRIEKIEALRVEARNFVETCPAPGIKELMARAEEHVRLAREHAQRGDLEEGAAEASIARNLFQRITEACAR